MPEGISGRLVVVSARPISGRSHQIRVHLAHAGLLDRGLKFRPLVLPDVFIDHDKPEIMYARAGLDAAAIVQTVFTALGREMGAAPLVVRA